MYKAKKYNALQYDIKNPFPGFSVLKKSGDLVARME